MLWDHPIHPAQWFRHDSDCYDNFGLIGQRQQYGSPAVAEHYLRQPDGKVALLLIQHDSGLASKGQGRFQSEYTRLLHTCNNIWARKIYKFSAALKKTLKKTVGVFFCKIFSCKASLLF